MRFMMRARSVPDVEPYRSLVHETCRYRACAIKRPCTTVARPATRLAPDLVQRDCPVGEPDKLRAATIACVAAWAGFLCLAVVVDAWRRLMVGLLPVH